jgi:hypothetical protein
MAALLQAIRERGLVQTVDLNTYRYHLIRWIIRVFRYKFFSRSPSIRLVSIAALAQALIGLASGRSPSSSSCSPSAQALLSRARSRSSTLFFEPIMHFLIRPFCYDPLVKFRRQVSKSLIPSTLNRLDGWSSNRNELAMLLCVPCRTWTASFCVGYFVFYSSRNSLHSASLSSLTDSQYASH